MTKEDRIDRLSLVEGILDVPKSRLQTLFRLSFDEAGQAHARAENRLRNAKVWNRELKHQSIDRCLRSIKANESLHPNIHLWVVNSKKLSEVAVKFRVSRQYAQKVSSNLRKYAALVGSSPREVATLAARGSLPLTRQESFERKVRRDGRN